MIRVHLYNIHLHIQKLSTPKVEGKVRKTKERKISDSTADALRWTSFPGSNIAWSKGCHSTEFHNMYTQRIRASVHGLNNTCMQFTLKWRRLILSSYLGLLISLTDLSLGKISSLRLVVSDDDGYDVDKVLWGFNNVDVGIVDEFDADDGVLMPLSVL